MVDSNAFIWKSKLCEESSKVVYKVVFVVSSRPGKIGRQDY